MLVAPQAGRATALARLDRFVDAAGSRYARTRNFDFGPERRGNVSLLSPYIRHRLLLETEVLERVLARHSPSAAGKFVEEVFWRAYFKGWLEQHPTVWGAYREGVAEALGALENDPGLETRYRAAVSGATGIEGFDAWATELQRTGYLHNHARMWFASIWVYTLELPWHLGADFFLRHLADGDPASNTLSWRWVCGLHTRGKTYLARVSNITSYTDNRFNPQGQLAIAAPPLTESQVHPRRSLPAADPLPEGGRIGLLVTEEDGCAEDLFAGVEVQAVFGLLATAHRSPLPVGLPAADFAHGAVDDAVRRAAAFFGVSGETREAGTSKTGKSNSGERRGAANWSSALVDWATRYRLDSIVTAWVPVGPTDDALADAEASLGRHGVQLHRVRRAYDDVSWPHAGRGYFKLRERIPEILARLDIAGSADSRRSRAI